ncbi:hypothetical protein M3Y97_00241800 [Aphelenchoides bicaudatus]|nr:hypothetical protein M3Y97_00241800 [Aphelenchoides bicaudatus]
MSTTSNVVDSGRWPHDKLTHLAVHTPVQPHRAVVDGAPNEYPAPAAQSFPQSTYPQELIRHLSYSSSSNLQVTSPPPTVVSSSFGTTSPTVLNNNNTTKLELNVTDEIVEEGEKTQLTPIKHELIHDNSIEALNNNGWDTNGHIERPHSANDLTSKQVDNSNNLTAHHPLLSPLPIQSSRLSWLADSKSFEIAQPKPLKPEDYSSDLNGEANRESGELQANDNLQESNGRTLNEEETARLLLTLSQNFVGNDTAVDANESASTIDGQRHNSQKSRTFFRPPGHKGSSTTPADGNGLICEICGFGCSSRFHYNSHMNTHGCHLCQLCGYRSRTEGRLKKHMQDSHTAEQRQEISRNQPAETSTSNQIELINETESQRLPGTLEQIRALADNSINFTGEQPNGTPASNATATADPQTQTVRRGGGKPKKYSCKQCGEISTTKEAHWRHNKTHIPIDKQLSCPECDFVTEYKHHLQYHLRNHVGSKPFKCSKCEYSCVNKSMLNSHLKSHTPVYQFRCMDCTYQTKYCHSLKMHTYKYNHRRVQGQVYTVGDENGESLDDGMMETESLQDIDIPEGDPALQLYKQTQSDSNQFQQPEPVRTTAASQLNMINQQSAATPRLSSLLLQPIASSPVNTNTQLQQFLLQQQQRFQNMGQVQQLIHNAANNFLPRHKPLNGPPLNSIIEQFATHKCDICDFSSVSQEELLTHKVNHFLYNQQQHQVQTNALNLYNQRLTNNSIQLQQPSSFLDLAAQLRNHPLQQQQPNMAPNHQIAISKADMSLNSHDAKTEVHNETPDPSGATTTTTASTPRVAYTEEHMSGSSEIHDEASSSPSDSHKSMDNASSSSPHSASSAPHSGSKKRKARKLDEISQRLQDKCSPDNTDGQMSPSEKIESSNTNGVSSIAQPIPSTAPLNGFVSGPPLNSIIGQFATRNRHHSSMPMPYTCQHCMIAFNDQALYQIHLGYHGYDSPYKCNRCGHNADSALNFNLHLYQEKH